MTGTGSRSSAAPSTAAPPALNRRRARGAEGRRCVELTREGQPCTGVPVHGEPRCPMHAKDPVLRAKIDAARKRAGLATALRRLPPDIPVEMGSRDGVRALLKATAEQVIAGRISPAVSNAVNALAGTALKLAELELSAQLADLDAQLAELQNTGPRYATQEAS